MPERDIPPGAVADTSPLLFLHRTGTLDLLGALFSGGVWVPPAVRAEIEEGAASGYDMPDLDAPSWMNAAPEPTSPPSEWLALDLGPGELAALSLALEHSERIVLLDDALARRVAKGAGLTVWGTLRVVLEAKRNGHVERVTPLVNRMEDAGMWVSGDVRRRILRLAGEA